MIIQYLDSEIVWQGKPPGQILKKYGKDKVSDGD